MYHLVNLHRGTELFLDCLKMIAVMQVSKQIATDRQQIDELWQYLCGQGGRKNAPVTLWISSTPVSCRPICHAQLADSTVYQQKG